MSVIFASGLGISHKRNVLLVVSLNSNTQLPVGLVVPQVPRLALVTVPEPVNVDGCKSVCVLPDGGVTLTLSSDLEDGLTDV